MARPVMSRRRARLSAADTCARVSLAALAGSGALASSSRASGRSGRRRPPARRGSTRAAGAAAAAPRGFVPRSSLLGARGALIGRAGGGPRPAGAAGGSRCGPCRPARARRPRRSRHRTPRAAPGTGRPAGSPGTPGSPPRQRPDPRATAVRSRPARAVTPPSPREPPTRACSWAIPATPSGSRFLASTFPASSITSTSWWSSAQSSPTNSRISPPDHQAETSQQPAGEPSAT